MLNSRRFPFVVRPNSAEQASAMPYLPIMLTYQGHVAETMALLDTGASVNVLPYEVGLQLGAVWEDQEVSVQLSGNLAQQDAKGLVLSVTVADFSPVLLVFAWTKVREIPLILGQVNFFMEFDICFYRADLSFELCSRAK